MAAMYIPFHQLEKIYHDFGQYLKQWYP